MWVCPICTLHSGRAKQLNDVPYRRGEPEDKKNQATDHLRGKTHEKNRRLVAAELFTNYGCTDFFRIIGSGPRNFDYISPVDAIKKYTEECGGDGDKTILKLTPAPPPPPRLVKCDRAILSADYATKAISHKHIMRTQLLCCWDDPLRTTQCTRHPCPYRHATDLQKQLPAGTPEQQPDFYEFIPCNFAGMPGGCQFHNTRFKGENWNVPEWRLETQKKTHTPGCSNCSDCRSDLPPCKGRNSGVCPRIRRQCMGIPPLRFMGGER